MKPKYGVASFCAMLILLSSAASAQFDVDAFAGTSGTALTSHTLSTPVSGAWSNQQGAGLALNGSGGVYLNNTYGFCFAAGTPAGTQYYAQCDLHFATLAGKAGPMVCASGTGSVTNYRFIVDGSTGAAQITKWLATSETTLGTVTLPTAYSGTMSHTLTLAVNITGGVATLTATEDGTRCTTSPASVTDSSPLATGQAGVCINSTGPYSAATGPQIANFKAFDGAFSAGSASATPSSLPTSTAGQTVTLTGTGTSWLNGTTTFALSGAGAMGSSVTATSISGQVATLTLTTGATAGALTFTDSTNATTASVTLTAPVQATGVTIAPSPASGSSVAAATPINLPISFTTGTVLGANLVMTGTLASGLTGSFTSVTGGVTITGASSPYTITVAAGTYPSGVALVFTPTATATSKTITFTHSGGGGGFASGGDPGPFTYTVTSGPVTILPTDANLFWSPYNWVVTGSEAHTSTLGAYVKFGFSGASLKLNVNTAGASGGQYYSVDNGPFVATGALSSSMTLTVPAGTTHTFSLYVFQAGTPWDATPPSGAFRITSFTLDAGASTLACSGAIAIKPNRALFYGDSIYSGQYTEGGTADPFHASVPMIANGLNAEYGQVGWTGTGWTASYNGVPPLFAASGSSFTWDKIGPGETRLTGGKLGTCLTGTLTAQAPDYVFIEHGTNDESGVGATRAGVPALVSGFLGALRAACGTGYGTGAPTQIFEMVPYGSYGLADITGGVTSYEGGSLADPTDPNTFLLDVSAQTRYGLDQKGISSAATLWSSDGLHPLTIKNAQIASIVVQAVNAKILAALPRLRPTGGGPAHH